MNNNIYISLKNAIRAKLSEFFYDFGNNASYEKVKNIHDDLKKSGYNVTFEKSGLRIKL